MKDWLRTLAVVAVAGTTLTVSAAEVLKEGAKAPDVTLKAVGMKSLGMEDGKEFKLSDITADKHKNVVLFFYPKAMTGGCTKESCGFRDVYAELAKLDTVVIGISTDKAAEQQKFIDKEKLNFPLIADPEKKATEAFGALGKGGYASRCSFVIDKTGVVRKVYTTVDVNTHPAEVLQFVRELK